MSRFREVFPKAHTFLAVIHVENMTQALMNVGVALDNGADGVFLINHTIHTMSLLGCYEGVRTEYPSAWIGLNLLGLHATSALRLLPENASGLWCDDTGLLENQLSPKAERFHQDRARKTGWNGLYFGGVAFKYQPEVNNLRSITGLATRYMDVITTSGPGTGIPPDVEKIRLMHEVARSHPIAIASGITPENVDAYLPYVDCFLSDSETELNPERVRKLADKMST